MDAEALAIEIIATFVALVGVLAAILIAWIRPPLDFRRDESETVQVWQEVARKSAQDTLKYSGRIDALEYENAKLRTMIESLKRELQAEIEALRIENSDVREYVERLVHQIRSLGHEPIKMGGKR